MQRIKIGSNLQNILNLTFDLHQVLKILHIQIIKSYVTNGGASSHSLLFSQLL